MAQNDLKVAIIGYGLAGSVFHAPLIASTAGMRIAAILSRSKEKQEKAKKDFPQAKIVQDLEELASIAGELDLVVIASPNREHAPQAITLMEKGINVVVDKPVALNAADCRRMIECSKKNRVLLSVFQNRRWDNDFLSIKELLRQGVLGDILRFESRFERYRPQVKAEAWRENSPAGAGGGILFDLGTHLIDQVLQLFGPPEEIYAELMQRRDGVLADDDCFLALKFRAGQIAHLWMSAIAAVPGPRFRVLGRMGAYEKYGLDPQEDSLRSGMTPLSSGWGEEAESAWGKLTLHQNGQIVSSSYPSQAGSYQSYYAMMKDAVKNSSPVPVDPEETLLTLEIIERCRELVARSMKSTAPL